MRRVWERGGKERGMGREGKADEGGAVYGHGSSHSGEEEERDMYKTSGHGRAFLAGPGVFLGSREETCRDNIECVFDRRLGSPEFHALCSARRTLCFESGDLESEQANQHSEAVRVRFGETVADGQGVTSPSLQRTAKEAGPQHTTRSHLSSAELVGGEISPSPVSNYASLY